MGIAVILALVVIGSVVFHFLSPWWWTPIASNWHYIDNTIIVTFWITGTVFAAGSFNSSTLLEALEFGGGSGVSGATRILLRAAVAAVLNAANSGVGYPASVATIVSDVNAAIATADRGAILALASSLDATNNLGCPLNNSNNN